MRKPNEIQLMLDGVDFVKQFVSDLRKDVKMFGGDDTMTYTALKSDSKLRKEFAKLIAAGASATKEIIHIFSNLSLADRIARGKYDWVNNDITEEHYPEIVPADYTKEFKLYHFDRLISFNDAIKEMKGFRPATIAELLAIGETQPELQKQFPIIALGSVWRAPYGYLNVPGLHWNDDERKLRLYHQFERDLSADFRFLAVRK